MEEILASIRRIISEDEPAQPAAAGEPAPQAVAPEPEPEPAPAPEPEPEVVAIDEEPLELTQRYEEPAPTPASETIGDIEAVTQADPFPASQPEPEPAPPPPAPEPVAAVTAAMGAGITVEELVRSIVEPQVRQWLEDNLDGILRQMLREKLERVFR